MNKAVKKIKKIKAELDKLEAKEETLFEDLDEAIDELEESEDQDVESGPSILCNDGSGVDCLSLFGNVDPTVSRICFCFFLTLSFRSSVSIPSRMGDY